MVLVILSTLVKRFSVSRTKDFQKNGPWWGGGYSIFCLLLKGIAESIGASLRMACEILCLPYAGFFLLFLYIFFLYIFY